MSGSTYYLPGSPEEANRLGSTVQINGRTATVAQPGMNIGRTTFQYPTTPSATSSPSTAARFGPGQAAIFTPDPTLNGPWTHTDASIPLFKTPAPPAAPGGSNTAPSNNQPPIPASGGSTLPWPFPSLPKPSWWDAIFAPRTGTTGTTAPTLPRTSSPYPQPSTSTSPLFNSNPLLRSYSPYSLTNPRVRQTTADLLMRP